MSFIFSFLIQANLLLIVFWGAYYGFCRSSASLQIRRILLWAMAAGAFSLPLIPFSVSPRSDIQTVTERLRTIALPVSTVPAEQPVGTWLPIAGEQLRGYALMAYGGVAVVLILRFLVQWLSLFRMYRRSRTRYGADGTRLHVLPGAGASFSFFCWIFLYERDMEQDDLPYIIAHEAAHVRGWHSLDVCFGQVLTALCWFNPVAWMYGAETKRLTEYLADRQVLRQGVRRKDYQMRLLRSFAAAGHVQAGCHFNASELRSRIVMMNRSSDTGHYKMALVVFLLIFAGAPFSGVIGRSAASFGAEPVSPATSALQGIWMMRHPDKATPTYSYKLLNKDGTYLNLRSYDDRRTFTVMRQGTYRVIAPDLYVENLKEEFGEAVLWDVEIPITYTVADDRLHVSFRLGGQI